MMTAEADIAPVAVVIPTYNHAHFLAAAIESVLAQDAKASEILVVDDGSDDEPEAVLARFPGVRMVAQANAGLAAARNRGIRETSAPYLLFLDADDRLLPDAIDRGLRSLGSDEAAAFTYGAYEIVDSATGKRTKAPFRPVPAQAFSSMLRGNPVGMHGAVLYRRRPLEMAGGFREHLRACEDYDLYLRLARDHPVLCHPGPCAEYWRHGANMSADPAFMLGAALQVLRDYEPEARRRGLIDDYRQGVRSWKRHYIEVWRGLARPRPAAAVRSGAGLLALAPATMLREIGGVIGRRRAER